MFKEKKKILYSEYKKEIKFKIVPNGYFTSNTSIIKNEICYILITRCSSIIYDPELQYKTLNQNIVSRLDEKFEIMDQYMIEDNFLQNKKVQFLGFEDARIIDFRENKLLFSATHFHEDNLPHISIVETLYDKIVSFRCLKAISKGEKNWLMEQGNLDIRKVIYHWDPFTILSMDKEGIYNIVFQKEFIEMKSWQGSCPPIPFNEGFLALIHQDGFINGKAYFYHRFVYLDNNMYPLKYSDLFYFEREGVEYCCGMCFSIDNNNIILTYTSDDKNPALMSVPTSSIYEMINNNIFSIIKKTKYTAIIIEPRKHKALEFVLNNFSDCLSDEWKIILFHGTENEEFSYKIVNELNKKHNSKIKLVKLDVKNLTLKEYCKLLSTKSEIYDYVDTEYFIVFQTDSMMFKQNAYLLDSFIKENYDYVGAPWLKTRYLPTLERDFIGNGGFSLRKTEKMLEIISKNDWNLLKGEYDWLEDLFFTKKYDNVDIKKPTYEKAMTFSVEEVFSILTLGCHKPWGAFHYNNFVKFYPEVSKLRDLQETI